MSGHRCPESNSKKYQDIADPNIKMVELSIIKSVLVAVMISFSYGDISIGLVLGAVERFFYQSAAPVLYHFSLLKNHSSERLMLA
jgi:hypothetical protein